MKHFYDLEFLERCDPEKNSGSIDFISIGVVSEDGNEYYAVNSDIQTDKGLHDRISEHDFLAKEVIRHLPLLDDRAVAEQLREAAINSDQNGVYFRPGRSDAEYLDQRDPVRLDWALDLNERDVKPRWVIANEVRQYFLDRLDHGLHDDDQDDVGEVELWANYGAYDHVRLMWLWGPMIKRPKHLPMFTHDLQQFARFIGVSRKDFPKQESGHHDALADARQDQAIWTFLDAQHKRQEAGL